MATRFAKRVALAVAASTVMLLLGAQANPASANDNASVRERNLTAANKALVSYVYDRAT